MMHLLVSPWRTLVGCLQPQELQRLQGHLGNSGPRYDGKATKRLQADPAFREIGWFRIEL